MSIVSDIDLPSSMNLFLTYIVCFVEIKLQKTFFENVSERAFDIVLMSILSKEMGD